MPSKQASTITIAKIGDHYSVDARGAFGGGWTRAATETELESVIIRAYQMYGSNPLGFEVIGAPESLSELVAKLTASRVEGDAVLTIRLPKYEADLIRGAAGIENRSVNQWCRMTLFKNAQEVLK